MMQAIIIKQQHTSLFSSLMSLHSASIDDEDGVLQVTPECAKCLYNAPSCDFTVLSSTFLRLRFAAPESYFELLIPDMIDRITDSDNKSSS